MAEEPVLPNSIKKPSHQLQNLGIDAVPFPNIQVNAYYYILNNTTNEEYIAQVSFKGIDPETQQEFIQVESFFSREVGQEIWNQEFMGFSIFDDEHDFILYSVEYEDENMSIGGARRRKSGKSKKSGKSRKSGKSKKSKKSKKTKKTRKSK